MQTAGVDPYDQNGGETPIPVTDFIEYGRWFQEREVPALEQERVSGVARLGSGFEVELASGERIRSATVLMAIGTAPFAYLPPELETGRRESWIGPAASATRATTTICLHSGARRLR